jgi:hypothetical protein
MTSTAPPTVIQNEKLFRKGKDVARADLERHHIVHQARHKRHGHEEDHDDAVRGEHLIEVVRVEVAVRAVEGQGLLRADHERVGKAAQEHDKAQHHVHDADLLVIDAGEPLLPEIAPELEIGERGHQRDAANGDAGKCDHDDGFGGQRVKAKSAQKRCPVRMC